MSKAASNQGRKAASNPPTDPKKSSPQAVAYKTRKAASTYKTI
jgi:hypothetical protein